jgi:hypothetical protein
MTGFCAQSISPICTAFGIRSPDGSGNCDGVSSAFNQAKIKNQVCCLTGPARKNEKVPACSDVVGLPCEGLGGFREWINKCCGLGGSSLAGNENLADGQNLAIAYCDQAGISVVTEACTGEFTCVEYWGYTRKGKRSFEPVVYAMCEMEDS